MNPAVTQLSLYDVANVKGVAADVSHINSRAKVEVSGFTGAEPTSACTQQQVEHNCCCRRVLRAMPSWRPP
jgi:malate/lactate dehydrogenase